TRALARDTPKKVKLYIKYISQQPENCFLFPDIHTIIPIIIDRMSTILNPSLNFILFCLCSTKHNFVEFFFFNLFLRYICSFVRKTHAKYATKTISPQSAPFFCAIYQYPWTN
ncbi:MAG: hypothetical protein RML94_13605, partial [Bacteroidia bacterium]|nr:hypothetical protein [Bacteroidia bacterium]